MVESVGKFERGVLVSTAGAALTAVVATVAKDYGVTDSALAGLAVASPHMVAIVHESFERMRDRRTRLLGVGFTASAGTAEEARARLEAAQDAPGFEAVMVDTYRRLTEALDDAVIPALGILAGEYEFGGKSPDAFFRGLGRMLCDLDAEHFHAFRAFVRAVAEVEQVRANPSATWLTAVPSAPRDGSPIECIAVLRAGARWQTLVRIDRPVAERLFHLMEAHGLGLRENIGFEAEGSEHSVILEPGYAPRIVRVIDPGAARAHG
jgi:hypothetical protein